MKKHVLFVESESDNILLMRRIVEHMGHQFSNVSELSSVEQLATSPEVDLILMTASSEGSLAMVRTIKRHPQLNHIPVVAVVHAQHELLKEQSFLAGCDGFLQKPADIPQIQALLAEFLTLSVSVTVEENADSLVAAD
jgi:CheY-like chemotaxis protein